MKYEYQIWNIKYEIDVSNMKCHFCHQGNDRYIINDINDINDISVRDDKLSLMINKKTGGLNDRSDKK